jgi:glycosyltransferase involved in cell wall biosynthesis
MGALSQQKQQNFSLFMIRKRSDTSAASASPAQEKARRTLLLYAAVVDPGMLRQGFYAAEVAGLLEHPSVEKVLVTNRLEDVRTWDYDGVVSYFYSYSAFVAFRARLRGKPVVATGGGEQVFRSMAPSLLTYLGRVMLFWMTLLFVNRILATSSTDYQRMRRLGWFRRSAIELGFHSAEVVDRLDRAHFGNARAAGSMVTICGMDTAENMRRKGLFRAFELLARTRRRIPDARLTVIGRTTCVELAREEAARLGCADAIDFVGYVSDEAKVDILRASRYYVQLSEYEGFGIGALEALALGCEVVHSNVGGLRDSVADYGVVLPGGEPRDLDLARPYAIADWDMFERHMAQFKVRRRADTILHALGFE